MRIAVLGAGAWGSALSISLCADHEVLLWARSPEACAKLAARRCSPYLPEVAFPEPLRIEPEFASAVRACDVAIAATATAGLRETAAALAAHRRDCPLLWACKGFVTDTGLLPHQVVSQVHPESTRVGALSGPSFALEVARGLPAALTIASRDTRFATDAATALNSARLRIYSSTDVIGVEIGAALKNVVAIAAGICDGLALGANARAALVTRGLAELARLGARLGGQPETFMGLTGLGDLVLTTTGELSRNRAVGIRLAGGQPLEAILAELGHVAEGVPTARAARALAREHGVEMPITEAVCAVLFEQLAPSSAVRQLLSRDPKAE